MIRFGSRISCGVLSIWLAAIPGLSTAATLVRIESAPLSLNASPSALQFAHWDFLRDGRDAQAAEVKTPLVDRMNRFSDPGVWDRLRSEPLPEGENTRPLILRDPVDGFGVVWRKYVHGELERLGFDLSEDLGYDKVPVTVPGRYNGNEGSFQLHLDRMSSVHAFLERDGARREIHVTPTREDWAFHYMAGNIDVYNHRNRLVHDELFTSDGKRREAAVDFGIAFPIFSGEHLVIHDGLPIEPMVMIDSIHSLSGNDLSQRFLRGIRAISLPRLLGHYRPLLAPVTFDALRTRVNDVRVRLGFSPL